MAEPDVRWRFGAAAAKRLTSSRRFLRMLEVNSNVRLRDVETRDLALFFAHQRDPEAAAMAAFASRDRAAFDEHWAKILVDNANLIRTVIVGSEIAGNVSSFTRDGVREVGYWIDRTYWGRGIATAALAAFLRLDQTRPLCAGVAKHNPASLRILQKCGFTFHAHDDSHVILVLSESV